MPYVWLTRERINDVRELRGKRIGVNRAGSKPWLIIQVPLDGEVIDFAYDYLHANSEPTLYPPADAVENLIRMSGYMDKKLQSISAKQVVDLSVLDELGTKQNERVHR